MKIRIISFVSVLFMAFAMPASADNTFDSENCWNVSLRAGYALGGTVPMGFPDEMRGLNGYSPKFNLQLGVDVERRINESFGLQTGLFFERHGFKSDVKMRQYEITLHHGGELISGPFTGNVVINIVQNGFTVPLQGTWHFCENGKLRFGPYVQFLTGRQFSGYAYGNKVLDENGKWNGSFDAYLRRDEVRGEKIEIGDIYIDDNGNEVDKRGTFDGDEYDDYLRWFQCGVTVGGNYNFTRNWGVYADLSYGLNSAFTSADGNPVSMKLHPLYFTVGVSYTFGK